MVVECMVVECMAVECVVVCSTVIGEVERWERWDSRWGTKVDSATDGSGEFIHCITLLSISELSEQ